MATLDQATAPRTSKRSLRKLERRPPVHDGSREVTTARDRQDAYIGEDPFDGNDLDPLDRLSAIDAHNRQSRKLLDYLAGDKYLDDAESGDDIIDGEDGGFYSDEPRSRRHQSIPYTSAPPGATVVNPNEINSDQLGQIVAEEAERKQKARAEKELAWQKVRQLLIEEEEKVSAMSIDSTSKSVDSSRGEKDEDNINTVKLLDSLVRSGADDFAYNRSVSSDVDVAPVVDSSLAQCQVSASNSTASTGSTSEVKEPTPQTFARHMDRMVYPSTDFESIERPGLEESGGLPFYTVVTRPQIPVMEFTAVLGASGTSDKLAQPAGISRFVYSNKEALGIVCYFPNLGTSDETKAKEFSWTAQLKHPMLDKLREIGLDLENVVYYRGEMHYLVMTPKRQNLVGLHVVNEDRPSSTDLVMDYNINNSALHEFVKSIVDFAGIPRKTDFTRVSLFDFSALTRADKAASVLSSHGRKLYVGLIGDSLLEPVWHNGVGTCSGFLSALDGVWMVTQIGRKSDEQLLADREAAYQVTMRLSGNHLEEMQKNVRKYTVDPRSRYTVHFP
ncbi:hypothetical protein PI125_g1717 [Phytophthora idaei]|nr:hypothetical protein PI125_g1717 [Phytophthora idaei]